MVNAQAFDIGQQKVRVIPVSRIDEHRFSLRYQQCGIRLSHIKKIRRQIFFRLQRRLITLSVAQRAAIEKDRCSQHHRKEQDPSPAAAPAGLFLCILFHQLLPISFVPVFRFRFFATF